MYDKIENNFPNFRTIPFSKSKFIFLMSQETINIIKLLPLHTHRWNEIRDM